MKTLKLKILSVLVLFVFVACKKESKAYLEGNWDVYKVETTILSEGAIPGKLPKTEQEWITYYSGLMYIRDGLIVGLRRVYFLDTNVVYEEEGLVIPIAKKVTDVEIMFWDAVEDENGGDVLNYIYLKKE